MLLIDGYSLVLPPEWELLDLREDHEAAVDQWLDRRLLGLGSDVRRTLRPRLREPMLALLAGLQARGGSSVLLPSTPLDRTLVNPMLVVSLLAVEEGMDPLDVVVATAASDPTAELIEQDSFVGIRSLQDVLGQEPLQQSAVAQVPPELRDQLADSPEKEAFVEQQVRNRRVRRVRYLVGRPDVPDRWLDIAGSVGYHDDPDSRELADAITSLFDAVIDSLTWEIR